MKWEFSNSSQYQDFKISFRMRPKLEIIWMRVVVGVCVWGVLLFAEYCLVSGMWNLSKRTNYTGRVPPRAVIHGDECFVDIYVHQTQTPLFLFSPALFSRWHLHSIRIAAFQTGIFSKMKKSAAPPPPAGAKLKMSAQSAHHLTFGHS